MFIFEKFKSIIVKKSITNVSVFLEMYSKFFNFKAFLWNIPQEQSQVYK